MYQYRVTTVVDCNVRRLDLALFDLQLAALQIQFRPAVGLQTQGTQFTIESVLLDIQSLTSISLLLDLRIEV